MIGKRMRKKKEDGKVVRISDRELALFVKEARDTGLSIADARRVAWLVRKGGMTGEQAEKIIREEPSSFIKWIVEKSVKKEKK